MPLGDANWPMPVNVTRLIATAQKIFHIDPKKPTDLNPIDVVMKVCV